MTESTESLQTRLDVTRRALARDRDNLCHREGEMKEAKRRWQDLTRQWSTVSHSVDELDRQVNELEELINLRQQVARLTSKQGESA